MANAFVFEDIMLDDEPLGLADELVPPDAPFTTVISTDEEREAGEEVFFGVELPIDDIGEVQGSVRSCQKRDKGDFRIAIQILGLDKRHAGLLTDVLKGERERNPGDLIWATGIRQTNGTFATVVNSPAGLLNVAQLAKITEIAKRGAGLAKVTHAQRVILLLKPEQQEGIREELNTVGLNIGVLHHGIRNIRGCCGALCEWDQGDDALKLSLEIDQALFGRPTKHDVKIAVSGCPRNCMEAYCVDIGLIATNGRYDVFVGGVSSSVHFKGLKLAENIPPTDAIQIIERILEWYESNAEKGERLYKTLERIGHSDGEGKSRVFAPAAAMFDGMDIGDDISSRLKRTLARSYGLLKMREAVVNDQLLVVGCH